MSKQRAQEVANIVNAAMGKGTVEFGSDPHYTVKYLATGIVPVDEILGGGFARGRFTELFGDYSTLKSYIGYKSIATTQAAGGTCALIDTEHAYDEDWAKEIGVDTGSLIIKQPDTGEEAMDIAELLIRNDVDLIVFDSVAATVPRAEADIMLSGDKNIQPARLAQLMSTALRRLTTANATTAVVWINQTRLNVGVMFGNPETTSGGKALGFYSSIRMACRKAGKVTINENVMVTGPDGKPKKATSKKVVGMNIRLTLEKSKLSKPYKEVFFTFDLATGQVDELGYLINRCIEEGHIKNAGGSWTVKGSTAKTRGFDQFKTKVNQNQLRALLGLPAEQPRGRKPLRRKPGATGSQAS